MIPKECKRLAEVDFPIAVVSKHSAREKSIRHGHPSTLHLWWARRPLAACRAMLMALLLPDPCDDKCPEEFRSTARNILVAMNCRPRRWESEINTGEGLRKTLLEFIGDFANWDNATNADYLAVARALVKAAYPEETPLVVDPFAGGGSIPLEALRLGCEAFASDLNPVACLILKVMLEDIPRHGPELAEELRRVGKEIKEEAEKELAEFYPKDPDGATPIAYLWARTVKCESPNCGAEIPLMRSFWLCKQANRKRALRYDIVRPNGQPPHIEFEVFEPKLDKEIPEGTVTRAKATCPCCGMVLPPQRVRAQLAEQRGGADVIFEPSLFGRGWREAPGEGFSPPGKGQGEGVPNRIGGARMTAVVTLHPGIQGRHYRLPTERDYQAVWKAQKRIKEILDEWESGGKKGLCPVPDEPLRRVPVTFGVINVWVYGVLTWGDLFNVRQKIELLTLANLIRSQKRDDLFSPLLMAFGRCVDHWSANAMWIQDLEAVAHTFGRQAIPFVWDFVEAVGFASGGANFLGQLDWVSRVFATTGQGIRGCGQVQSVNAVHHPLPDESTQLWFTDPPYYDSVPYSYISDYFYVWHRRVLGPDRRNLFEGPLTPKDGEIVAYLQDDGTAEDAYHRYENLMAEAFKEGKRLLVENGIGSVVFAHKTTEGWEALLAGLIRTGWSLTASWPISTERPVRLRSINSAALGSSIHLVCRPRPEDAPVGDWADVLRELPKRVGDWMERLQGEGIRGADLVFACIGPALEIFSRYSKVETAEGSEITLAEYLEKVWEVVGRLALEQVLGTVEAKARNGAAGAVEEDARLTALFLWTLQSTNGQEPSPQPSPIGRGSEVKGEGDEEEEDAAPRGKSKGFSLVFDVVRRFAQPLGIDLPKWEGRIIETQKGVVRLMAVSERAKELFGEGGADAVADWITDDPTRPLQLALFPELEEDRAPKVRGRGRRRKAVMNPGDVELQSYHEATTLDRVHAAMLLQSGGQANALRALINAEQDRGPDFLRLANALSALYPKGSEEKRLLDAMLLAVPR